MQILSLFVLTVSAGALPQSLTSLEAPALATTISINSTAPAILEKRAHHPWIGHFDNEKCSGKHIGNSRPELPYGHCAPFKAAEGYVSIYWGTFPLNILGLAVYASDNCQGKKVKVLLGHEGGHTCTNLWGLGPVNSVKADF